MFKLKFSPDSKLIVASPWLLFTTHFIHQWLVCDRWSDNPITFFFSCSCTATTSFFQFTEPGSYEVFCTEDPSLNASVQVIEMQVVEMQAEGLYNPLLYTHAALMGITFGILLPLGAFLAHHQKFTIHKITQPTGILLALVGFIMVLVYVSLSHGRHFRFLIHGVVGLALLLLTFLLMPALLFRKPWHKWHRRCGHVIAFFGMANVLLVSSLPNMALPLLILCSKIF